MWKIDKGLLKIDGKRVEQLTSRNVGGKFASTPRIVVMHFTAGGSARSSAQWFCSPQNTGSSAHVVIERDGSIIQCVNFETIAWHAGRSSWHGLSGLNRHAIGIELANWGYLRSSGGGWVTSTGKPIPDAYVARHRNGNPDGSAQPIGWEPYPDEQVTAAVNLVRALRAAYGIEEIVGHDDIAPVRKSDPGPAFAMARFRSRVLDGRKEDGGNTGVVASPGGLNLRSGAGTSFSVLALLKDKTRLELLGVDGSWLAVTALDAGGQPDKSGWVHSHYVKLD